MNSNNATSLKQEDHVSGQERALRERLYENGRACGTLPHETAQRMGFHGDFDPVTARQLYPEQPIGSGRPWC